MVNEVFQINASSENERVWAHTHMHTPELSAGVGAFCKKEYKHTARLMQMGTLSETKTKCYFGWEKTPPLYILVGNQK